MKRKLVILGLILTLVALPLAACAKPAPAPVVEPVIIRAVSFNPLVRADAWAYAQFIERFNKRAGGEAFISYLGGEEVIPAFPQGKAVIDGTIDMSNIWSSSYASYFPGVMTMILSKLTPMEERATGYSDYLAKGFREIGVVYLGRVMTNLGFYIFTNVKAEKMQDLAGLVITIGAPAWKPGVEYLGMSISTIPDAEIYTGLQTGVIDCSLDTVSTAFMMSLYEVVKYMVDHPLAPSGNPMVAINPDAWNKLSPEIQELMMETMLEVEAEMTPHLADVNANIKQQLVENGVELIYLEDSEVLVEGFHEAVWGNIGGVTPEELLKLKEMTGN